MAARSPNREPDDGTRPPLFTRPEWLQIVATLRLAKRPAEVLGLAVQGMYDREICDRLAIAPGTLRVHLRRCFTQLRTKRKLQLAHETFARLPPTPGKILTSSLVTIDRVDEFSGLKRPTMLGWLSDRAGCRHVRCSVSGLAETERTPRWPNVEENASRRTIPSLQCLLLTNGSPSPNRLHCRRGKHRCLAW